MLDARPPAGQLSSEDLDRLTCELGCSPRVGGRRPNRVKSSRSSAISPQCRWQRIFWQCTSSRKNFPVRLHNQTRCRPAPRVTSVSLENGFRLGNGQAESEGEDSGKEWEKLQATESEDDRGIRRDFTGERGALQEVEKAARNGRSCGMR